MLGKLSINECAEMLDKSPDTLRKWRKGQGKEERIPYLRFSYWGRNIWYHRQDVENFMNSPEGIYWPTREDAERYEAETEASNPLNYVGRPRPRFNPHVVQA